MPADIIIYKDAPASAMHFILVGKAIELGPIGPNSCAGHGSNLDQRLDGRSRCAAHGASPLGPQQDGVRRIGPGDHCGVQARYSRDTHRDAPD